MATHSSIVAWRIPWTEEADSNSPWGRKESDTTERLPLPTFPIPGEPTPQVPQAVKNLPAMQETQVRSLDWEDPLEKEMATHSSLLAWRILWTEEPEGLQSMGCVGLSH